MATNSNFHWRIPRYLTKMPSGVWLTLCVILTPLVLLAAVLIGLNPSGAGASSHREAPLISGDPTVDNLDVYAFVSPDVTDTVTLISNWIPFEEPGGGPNFYHFDPNARYLIKIDQDGNAIEDITYEWTFSKVQYGGAAGKDTFLYNTGPIGADYEADTDFNIRQYYTVTKITGDTLPTMTTTLLGNILMVPDNVGPRSTPNYEAIAANGVRDSSDGLPAGYKEFTGQRDDPFFVDVGSIFDLAGLRPFNTLHAIPLSADLGLDVLRGFNMHTTAIQVPISELVPISCTSAMTGGNKACVIGVWSTAERHSTIVHSLGAVTGSGPYVQVSRLGNPLVNEVVIDLEYKDAFNGVPPSVDATLPDVVARVTDPEVAVLQNALYAALDTIEETGRTDLVTIFLTGIPPVVPIFTTEQINSAATPSEQLRLNVAIKPTEGACEGDPLGLFNDPAAGPTDLGDLTAFPNGRRLEDDVTDIALRAVAQGYGEFLAGAYGGVVPQFKDLSPNNLLGDGVDRNDVPCLPNFPYMGTPHPGYENNHFGVLRNFLPTIFKNFSAD